VVAKQQPKRSLLQPRTTKSISKASARSTPPSNCSGSTSWPSRAT